MDGMMADADSPTVGTVHILGEPFRIRGGSPEELAELAQYVEAKLEEVRSRNMGLPPRSLLILTSLNIAEELFRVRREHEVVLLSLEERARRLRESLESEMQKSE